SNASRPSRSTTAGGGGCGGGGVAKEIAANAAATEIEIEWNFLFFIDLSCPTSSELQRQLPQPLARSGEKSVGRRGRDRRNSRLADSAGLLVARNDVDFDFWRLAHAQHRIVVEIRLLDAAVLERELPV